MYVILPSSTAGQFTFVNNSTNPNAALFISSITHGGATTRATTFVLDGTNTANNVVTNLSEGAGNATGGITKQGPGTWTIAGPGTFPAGSPLNVNQGTLIVQDPGAFGIASTCNVNSNGVLFINNVALTTATIALKNSGTVQLSGAQTVNAIAVNTAVGNTPNLSTTSALDVMTIGSTSSKVSGGAADSILNISGPGTVVVPFDNTTYVGKWSVNSGTLSVQNAQALGTGANINIAAGAKLDLTPLGGVSFNPTTSGLGGTGTGTALGSTAANIALDPAGTLDLATGTKAVNLTFTPTAFSGDTAHPALYISAGTLALGGNAFNINNAGGTPLGVGTYRIIQQASGNVTDGGGYAANITGSGKAANTVASIVVSGGFVNLNISAYVGQQLVWTGGAANANWDPTDSNWLKGGVVSLFNPSDFVTFNSVGSTNPTVTLVGTELPGSVTVDTSANNYTFTGSGQIAGSTSLLKKSPGTLLLNTVNSYTGGTIVSNGVLQVGAVNAISATGAGDVQIVSPGTLDLNANSQTINGLNGSGNVDTVAGGSPVLTIGNNNDGGTFSGHLKNTAGTLGLTKMGTGTEILSSPNTYSGNTTINLGTVQVLDPNALGSGASALNLNGGNIELSTNLNLLSLAGSAGTIANNTVTTTNVISIIGSATTTFGGVIADGTAGAGVILKVLGGNLTMSGGNTYSGGTIVASGATFNIANSPAGVISPLIASNSATLGLSGGSGTPGTPSSVTTVDGATVTFTSGALGKIWGGQFIGSASTTNVILNPLSFGGGYSFSNFLGVVSLQAAGTVRFINIPAGSIGGGDNTIFDWPSNSTTIQCRDAATVTLGEVRNGSSVAGIGGATTAGVIDTYILGAKNTDSTFHGFFAGSNNLVKAGSGRLTFDGVSITTNTDGATYTNRFYTQLITHSVNTTVSNGVLALVVPNNLSNSPTITLAASTATLDATSMGYISNLFDNTLTLTNQLLITNGTLEVYPSQALNGFGNITGKLVTDAGSTLTPGLPTGALTVSGTATLGGAVTMNLVNTNTPNSSKLAASAITVSGATLLVTNVGPGLFTGTTFTLFNHPVSGFASVTLPPTDPTGLTNYVWANNLAANGSITLTGGGLNPIASYSTNITATVSGNTITVSWPATHLGWELESQTNSIGVGLSNNWVTNTATASVTSTNLTIDPSLGAVFYRLVHP